MLEEEEDNNLRRINIYAGVVVYVYVSSILPKIQWIFADFSGVRGVCSLKKGSCESGYDLSRSIVEDGDISVIYRAVSPQRFNFDRIQVDR